jgi:hypothetical protein
MEQIDFFAAHGALDLRCDMVRHAISARRVAVLVRRLAIALVVALLALQVTGAVWQLPWSPWVADHRALLSLVNIALTLFTAAHEWCVGRRLEESEDALLDYVECRRAC